jgi:V8-like Glu-specific endopeptidase
MKGISFLLFSLLLISCDPYTEVDTYFINSSDEIIELTYNHYAYDDTTVFVQPNDSVHLTWFKELGKAKDFNCCLCTIGPVTITLADSTKQITKSIDVNDNWMINRKNTLVDCIFSLVNTDIQ